MRLLYLILALCLLIGPARAEPSAADPSPADRAAFQQIINGQIAAFQANDAATAFGFASPDLQAKFGSPATFIEIVKNGYMPVYRPKTVEFRAVVDSGGRPEQQVFVVGPDGAGYIAHYMMEKQPDGSWRISGCYLERAQDESV